MDCATCRLDVSARLDGEETSAPDLDVEAHLRRCTSCRRFAAAASRVADEVDLAAEVPASRSAELLTAMADARRSGERRIDAIRLGLVVVACTQLALALPGLLLAEGVGHSAHVVRHLGAWDVAFAIGFLVAAAQPVRVVGLLPMAAALTGSMLLAAGLDVASGSTSAVGEATHVLELGGLALLWALSRAVPRPSGVGRKLWVAS